MKHLAGLITLVALLIGCAPPQQAAAPQALPPRDVVRAPERAAVPERLPGPEVIVGRPGRAGQSVEDRRIGEEAHPEILQANGGVYRDPGLAAWLEDIVARLQPGPGTWRITLLDTPDANAFAVPGGYLYVTRGLLELANDEDELAGVIAHEISHLDARHPEGRQRRAAQAQGAALLGLLLGTVAGVDAGTLRGLAELGQTAGAAAVADYSREQEFEADALGVRYLARAGYDPQAAADFLESLQAQSELQARIAGRQYDPNSVDFLSSHPATGERVRAAAAEAARFGGGSAARDRARDRAGYLARIDGMIYGDAPAQGYVRGGGFAHPELGFVFEAPAGFRITNSAAAVRAENGAGAVFVMEGSPADTGPLTRFIADRWAPAIAEQAGGGAIGGLRQVRINGLEAARAVMPVKVREGSADMLMVAIRLDGAIYRLTGIAPRGSGLLPVMEAAAETFRALSPAEAAALRPRRVEILRVQRGDSAARLAALMDVEGYAEERFRVLNGLRPGEEPRPGDLVKIVR